MPEAHFELGNAHARAGQLDSAERSLRRALELQPANAGIMNNLGRVLLAMRRSEDAAAIWQRAVTLQPDLAMLHLNIGMVRHHQNRLDEAEQSLRRALEVQADYPEAVQQLAAVMMRRGRAHEALPLLAQALARAETADMKIDLRAMPSGRAGASPRCGAARSVSPRDRGGLGQAGPAGAARHTHSEGASGDRRSDPARVRAMGQGTGVAAAADRRGNRCRRAGAIGQDPCWRPRPTAISTSNDFSPFCARRCCERAAKRRCGRQENARSLCRRSPGSASSMNMYSSKPRTSGNAFTALQTAIGNALRKRESSAAPQLVEPIAGVAAGRACGLSAAAQPGRRRVARRAEAGHRRSRPCCSSRSMTPLQEIALRGTLPALTPIEDRTDEAGAAGPVPALGQGHLHLAAAIGPGCRARLSAIWPARCRSMPRQHPDVLIAGCGSGEVRNRGRPLLSRCARACRRRECRGSGLWSAPGAVAGTEQYRIRARRSHEACGRRPQLRRDRSRCADTIWPIRWPH